MSRITATIIADSVAMRGGRITTFELEYPRFIHSEFMTHRVFSRNAASSRAIPVDAMHKLISESPAMPVHWGKNQAGMQANTEVSDEYKEAAKVTWIAAARAAISYAKTLAAEGLHKQIVNRVTEPFVTMKTVVTATEWENFFHLRYHPDAQPEIFELAKLMCHARDNNQPNALTDGEWHLPYVDSYTDLEDAKKISASCCAQVSYRKSDDSLDKATAIYDRLINSTPCHASPVEHQATPMPVIPPFTVWPPGVTHRDRVGRYWSNNFLGWIQNRAILGI